MNKIPALTLGLAFMVSPISFAQDKAKLWDEDWYLECAARAAKEKVEGERQFVQLLNLCYHQAVPKKCRDVSENEYPPTSQPRTWGEALGSRRGKGSYRELCVIECQSAGYYSRTFGECSKG